MPLQVFDPIPAPLPSRNRHPSPRTGASFQNGTRSGTTRPFQNAYSGMTGRSRMIGRSGTASAFWNGESFQNARIVLEWSDVLERRDRSTKVSRSRTDGSFHKQRSCERLSTVSPLGGYARASSPVSCPGSESGVCAGACVVLDRLLARRLAHHPSPQCRSA